MIRNSLILNKIFRIKPKTIIHIGGHKGQDGPDYKKLGCELVIWGEADSSSASFIRERFPEDIVFESVFWNSPGLELDFYEFNQNEGNSAIAPIDNSKLTRKTKKITTTLDKELSKKSLPTPVLLVLDVQGAELHVLRGASKLLEIIDFVIIEIGNQSQGYVEMPTDKQINSLLKIYNFKPSIYRSSHDKIYRDHLFIKSNTFKVFYIKMTDIFISLFMYTRHLYKYKHVPESIFYCRICKI